MSRQNSSQRFRVAIFLFPIVAALLVSVARGQSASPVHPSDRERSAAGKHIGENKPPDTAAAPKASSDHSPEIQDNSFLVEEAYNQEFGVVQHIQTLQRVWDSNDWVYTFTQEWPVDASPRHQLSYTLTALQLRRASSVRYRIRRCHSELSISTSGRWRGQGSVRAEVQRVAAHRQLPSGARGWRRWYSGFTSC
jgi:hypothetical protein